MSTEIKDLLIKIRTDADQALKGMESVHKSTGNLGNIAKIAGAAMLAAGAAIGAGIGKAVSAANEQIRVDTQLQAVLKSTGNAAGLTFEELKKMASGLQETTTYGDEMTQTAQSMLLTFTNIGREVFPDVTSMALDMSTALGQDLKSSSMQLGKALNDPIVGMTALRRVGVAFTTDQAAMIKTLQESGDIMGAQKIILAELGKEFGGSAAAQAQTFDGIMKQIKNSIGDIWEDMGIMLMPILKDFAKLIQDNIPALREIMIGLFEGVAAALKELLPGIVDLVKSILPSLIAILKATAPMFTQLLKAILPIIEEILPPLTDLILYLVKEVLPLFLPIIGDLVKAVIPPLVTILKLLITDVLPPLMPLLKVFAELLNALTPVIISLLEAFMPLIEIGIKVLAFQLNLIIPIFVFLIEKVLIPFTGVIKKVLDAMKPLNDWMRDTLLVVLKKAKDAWYDVQYAALSFKDKIVEIAGRIKSGFNTIIADVTKIGKNIVDGLWAGIQSGWDWLIGKIKELGNLIPDWLKKTLGIASPSTVMKAIFKWIVPGIVEGILSTINLLDNVSIQIGAALQDSLTNIATSIKSFEGFRTLDATFKEVTIKEFNRFLGEFKSMFELITSLALTSQSLSGKAIADAIKSFIETMKSVAEELQSMFGTPNGSAIITGSPINQLFENVKNTFKNLNEMFTDITLANVTRFANEIKQLSDLMISIGNVSKEGEGSFAGFGATLAQMLESLDSKPVKAAMEKIKTFIQDFASATREEFNLASQSIKTNWQAMVAQITETIQLNLLPLQTKMIAASAAVNDAFIGDQIAISKAWNQALLDIANAATAFKNQVGGMLEFLKAVATGEGIDSTGIEKVFFMISQKVADLTTQLYEAIFEPVLNSFSATLMEIPSRIKQDLIDMMGIMRAELISLSTSLAGAFTSSWTAALSNFKDKWTEALQTVKAEATSWAQWFTGWINQVITDALLTLGILGTWVDGFHTYIVEVLQDLTLLFNFFYTFLQIMKEIFDNTGAQPGENPGEPGHIPPYQPPIDYPPGQPFGGGGGSSNWKYLNDQRGGNNEPGRPGDGSYRPIGWMPGDPVPPGWNPGDDFNSNGNKGSNIHINQLTIQANNAEELANELQRLGRNGYVLN